MIRDILCDSDCVYIENGICEKQNDVSMLQAANRRISIVVCDDHIPKREKE